eukprot:scaffold8374_cov175-Amphora_coffeaeformis.AAC.32
MPTDTAPSVAEPEAKDIPWIGRTVRSPTASPSTTGPTTKPSVSPTTTPPTGTPLTIRNTQRPAPANAAGLWARGKG